MIKNKLIKLMGILSVCALSLGTFAGCGGSNGAEDEGKGRVYYLNKKPEIQKQLVALGKQFEKKTGIPVTVTNGGSDYDSALRSEMSKKEAPTLFVADGPSFMQGWKDYAADLSGTKIISDLTNTYKERTLVNDKNKPIGIPFTMESYGIIYNKALLNKYFNSSWSSVKSINDLDNFDSLKKVSDEIQSHANDIGVEGAFTSTGLDSTSSFRFNFHLPSLPLYYEYKDNGQNMNRLPESVKGKYVKNMKKIFDLYITDSTVKRNQLSGKTMDDSISEFVTKKAVFFQDGDWVYGQIKGQGVPDSDIGVLPIYMGIKGEEKQGLSQVTSNYWCVNSKVSKADQQATLKFLDWMVTDKSSRKTFARDMNLNVPFKGFESKDYQVNNPLTNANREYQNSGKYDLISVPTVSHQWQQDLSTAELNYAQGTGNWAAVQKVFADDWAKEYKLTMR